MTQSALKLESRTGLPPSNSVSSILRSNAVEGVTEGARGCATLIALFHLIEAENTRTCLELCIDVPVLSSTDYLLFQPFDSGKVRVASCCKVGVFFLVCFQDLKCSLRLNEELLYKHDAVY